MKLWWSVISFGCARVYRGVLSLSSYSLDIENKVSSRYGFVIFGWDGKLLVCRLTSEFGKSIFEWVLFSMCGTIRISFDPFSIDWSFLSSSASGSHSRASRKYYWKAQLLCQPFVNFIRRMSWSRYMCNLNCLAVELLTLEGLSWQLSLVVGDFECWGDVI